MDARSRNALRTDIGQMSTRAINTAIDAEHAKGEQPTDELENDRWEKIDLMNDELTGRDHDLQDPSSGLSLHQPS